jgi:Leucine-rich repeat (LRR) protein
VLRALPEGLGRLAYLPAPGLKRLNLSNNEELTALPAGLCALAGLEELHLIRCGLITLPEGIGGLAGLKKLNLSSNRELTALPPGLGRLRNLEVLDLRCCPGLTMQPPNPAAVVRKGLPTLLAHLAAQGGEPAAGEAG